MAQTIATTSAAAASARDPRPGVEKKAVGEKRKVMRRDPEKRRRQNLQAQKRYRDRLRKRLDDLELLAASVVETRKLETATEAAQAVASSPSPTSIGASPPDLTPDDGASPDLISTPGVQAASTTPSNLFVPTPALIEKSNPMDLSLWDSETNIDPSYLTMTNYAHSGTGKDVWYNAYLDCTCPVRHVEVRTKNPVTFDSMEIVRIDAGMPSPNMNNLRIDLLCNFSAMWENCLQMGISEAILCEDDCLSFFYRPGATIDVRITNGDAKASESVVQTVKRIYKTLKPDLRPIKEQITVAHHPHIDIIPFPTLRSNLLKQSVAIDEDELFHDILNGLMCWGGAGTSRSDRNSGTGKASSGTPWDSRSWEAKPWFLRKYWSLLGGEDGELVRQSEWWRSLRGEDADIWLCGDGQPSAESLADFASMCVPKLYVAPYAVPLEAW
ncbi:unnamed protein product [Discula destructiva]